MRNVLARPAKAEYFSQANADGQMQANAKRFSRPLTSGMICHMIIGVYKFYISFSGETSEGV